MWISRQVFMLMRESKGGLSHAQIMKLSWRQFGVYLDALTWFSRENGKPEDKQENLKDDLRAKTAVPRFKQVKRRMLEEHKKELAKHKKFAQTRPAGEVHDMLAPGVD